MAETMKNTLPYFEDVDLDTLPDQLHALAGKHAYRTGRYTEANLIIRAADVIQKLVSHWPQEGDR